MTPERAAQKYRAGRLLTVLQDIREIRPNAREQVHILKACAQALEVGYGDESSEVVLAMSLVVTALERLHGGKQVDASVELAMLQTKL